MTWENRLVGWDVVAPDQLLANPKNYRRHPAGQREALRGSLNELDIIAPVIVNRITGHLLDGHARVEEYLTAGIKEVPVAYVEVSAEKEALALLSLDPIAAMAEADKNALDALLREVSTGEAGLQAMLAELAKDAGLYLDAPVDDPGAQMDHADELREKWGTERGQIWQLGEHRVMCGDSTSAEDVGLLLADDSVTLVATSPPYSDQREYGLGLFDWDALMAGVFGVARQVCASGDIVVNLGPAHKDGAVNFYWNGWLEEMKAADWPLFGLYIWDKGPGMPGEWNGRLAPAHEYVFHFRKAKRSAQKWMESIGGHPHSRHTFRQKNGSVREATSPDKIGQAYKVPDSVIRVSRASTSHDVTREHPAVFSVDFASFLISTWSVENESIFEPFLGSGTAVVAAEQLNRICYGMEIEPKYVAVSLERLAGMGLEPKLTHEGTL